MTTRYVQFLGQAMGRRIAAYYLARGFIDAGDRVLDIDCGSGEGAVIIADRAFQVLGVSKDITDAIRFEIEGFIEFVMSVPKKQMDVAIAFGEWEPEDILNITKRLITNREINFDGWVEVCRFNQETPIIIYDKEQ